MSDVRGSRVEQPDSSSLNQSGSALQEQVNQWRDETAEKEQLEKLYKKAEHNSLTDEERVQFAALNSFPGIKEAQALVVAEQTNKLSEEQSFQLNAWRRFPGQQQTRERELFVKVNSGKALSEIEQQEVAALLRTKEPVPPKALNPTDTLEQRNTSPPVDSKSLEFTNPYPLKQLSLPTKVSEAEQKQIETALSALTLMRDSETLLAANLAPSSPENTSRAMPSEGSAIQGAGTGVNQGQPDYTTKLLEIYPDDPVIVRLFNKFLLGQIAQDSADYIALMNGLQKYAGRK